MLLSLFIFLIHVIKLCFDFIIDIKLIILFFINFI